MKNSVLVEGHTDSTQYQGAEYSNWELSADRANSARKIMQENGLRADQVTQVRGFADQQLRVPDKPEDPSNRRVSIIVQYPDNPEPEPEPAKGAVKDGKEAGKKETADKKPADAKAAAGAKPADAKPGVKPEGKK
jgi:chemotaxis protein MotB